MSQIFRKVALDRLSSPEQLDQIMRVTSPMSWGALLASSLLVIMALVWGIYGTIPQKVVGQGILIEKESLFDVISIGEGQVMELMTDVGEIVEDGELIATINQPDLIHKLNEAQRTLQHLLAERVLTDKLGSDIHTSKEKHIAEQRQVLLDSIEISKTRISDLKERVSQYEKLLESGVVTKKTYLDIKAEYNREVQDVLKYREQLAALPASSFQASSEHQKEQNEIKLRIIKAEEQVDSLQDSLELTSRIVSPKRGRVNEIFKSTGAYIGRGEAVLNIETLSSDGNIYVSAYFAPDKGKRIQKGMTMLVAPSVAKREEYGVILGEVVSVSSFPASSRGMMNILENQKLVDLLSQDGPPIRVRAKLLKDPNSYSGFKWSSGKGAPIKLQSGTLCAVDVVIEEQAPISLLIPYLKRNLMGGGETF